MILINTHIYNITSGLPGQRPVIPRAAALVKKHPVAQFTKFVNVWFIKVASAGPSAMSPARCARCPCLQCSGPCAVSQPHDFLKIGNFATFSEFLHINGRHFSELFPFKFTYWPISVKCFRKSVRTFFEIRNTVTQPDRRGNFIYIDTYLRSSKFSSESPPHHMHIVVYIPGLPSCTCTSSCSPSGICRRWASGSVVQWGSYVWSLVLTQPQSVGEGIADAGSRA